MTQITKGAAWALVDSLTNARTLVRGLASATPQKQLVSTNHSGSFFQGPTQGTYRDALSIGGYSTFADARYAALREIDDAIRVAGTAPELAPLKATLDGAYELLRRDPHMVDPRGVREVRDLVAPIGDEANRLRNAIFAESRTGWAHLDTPVEVSRFTSLNP